MKLDKFSLFLYTLRVWFDLVHKKNTQKQTMTKTVGINGKSQRAGMVEAGTSKFFLNITSELQAETVGVGAAGFSLRYRGTGIKDDSLSYSETGG